MRNNKKGDHIDCSNAIECRRKKSTIGSKNAEKFFEFLLLNFYLLLISCRCNFY